MATEERILRPSTTLPIAEINEVTMNKFLSFLLAVLAIAQASAFMGVALPTQQRTVSFSSAPGFSFRETVKNQR
jgi:hypothetical protein